MAVAVVERFKQELMYGLSAGTKKCGRCGEVAVSGGSTVFIFSTYASCGIFFLWITVDTNANLLRGKIFSKDIICKKAHPFENRQ